MAKTARKVLDKALARVEKAGRALERDAPLAERVHEARRLLKKARAYLRLLAPALATKPRRKANRLCRDAGRALGAVRDAAAAEQAWHSLPLDGAPGMPLLQRRLSAERAFLEGGAERGCLRLLKKARRAARDLELDGGRRALAKGLRRSRERLDEAYTAARRERTDEAFHEWRKRAKDLRYQLELLEERPPAAVEALKGLTDLLGEDHDLLSLSGLLAAAPRDFGGAAAAARAARVVLARRRALRRSALALGARKPWKAAANLEE